MMLRIFSLAVLFVSQISLADETCMSPYMAKIVGQEDFVYVWTLGVEGIGDEQDKLVTIAVNPNDENYKFSFAGNSGSLSN